MVLAEEPVVKRPATLPKSLPKRWAIWLELCYVLLFRLFQLVAQRILKFGLVLKQFTCVWWMTGLAPPQPEGELLLLGQKCIARWLKAAQLAELGVEGEQLLTGHLCGLEATEFRRFGLRGSR